MSERQRHHPPEDNNGAGGSGPVTGGGNLGELHRAGEDLLAAGDEAIRQALSGDSDAFLRANRQKGGQ